MREEPRILQTKWMVTNGQLALSGDRSKLRIREEKKHLKEHVKERKIVEQREDFVRWEDGFDISGATVALDTEIDAEAYQTISKFYVKVSLLSRIRRWLKQ